MSAAWAALSARLAGLGLALPDGACARLEAFGRRLVEANERLNLTRITGDEELVEKHVVDALLALPHLPDAGRLVDVGSGGGVPGLVLAIARPGLEVVLVEATAKKAAFLAEAAAGLGLDRVRVVAQRAETAGRDPGLRDAADAATARAVGSVALVLELTLPFLRPGGRAVLYRGPTAEVEEKTAAGVAGQLGGGEPVVHRRTLAGGAERRLLVVPKIGPTPDRYPRRDGMPAKRPLTP